MAERKKKPRDGGPAFPSGQKLSVDGAGRVDDRMVQPLHGGQSRRQVYAGQNMAALLGVFTGDVLAHPTDEDLAELAQDAWRAADALLAEEGQ